MGIYSLAIVTMDLDWGFNLNFWSQSTESMTFWWMPGRYGTAMPEKFDDLYLEQAATLDPEKRCEIMKEMQQMIYDYVPYLFMHSESTVAARVSNLKGVTSRTEYYYWYDAYFEGESKSMIAGPYTMALVAPSLSSVYLKDIMASVVSCIKD